MAKSRLGVIGVAVLVSAPLGLTQTPQPEASTRGQRTADPAARQGGRGGGDRADGAADVDRKPASRKALLAWADPRTDQPQHDFTSHACLGAELRKRTRVLLDART